MLTARILVPGLVAFTIVAFMIATFGCVTPTLAADLGPFLEPLAKSLATPTFGRTKVDFKLDRIWLGSIPAGGISKVAGHESLFAGVAGVPIFGKNRMRERT